MGLRIEGKIERVNGKELSYQEFVERYLEKNEPVLITGLMDGWRACTDWVSENGEPNLHFLKTHFGNSIVQVAECGSREFTDQKRVEMSVSEFISHWIETSAGKCSSSLNGTTKDHPLLYLKDWHFVKEYPEYTPYTTPPYFVDDWLNLYLDTYQMHKDPNANENKSEINCSDYRFVYMGPKGTWTPLHADVFRSYSWSANVCGKKLWHFLSPSQCHLVFDRNMKNSVYDIFDDVSLAQFPGFKKAIWLECTQEQNEIIFVPSGWYHQVQNMEDTISINHNWFNAYNLYWVWKLLLKDYNEAKEYIEDIEDICDDFEGLCQRNLAANTGKISIIVSTWRAIPCEQFISYILYCKQGMNFFDFFTFIARFSFANLTVLHHHLKCEKRLVSVQPRKAQDLLTNLISISKVASSMISVDAFSQESLHTSMVKNQFAFYNIRKLLMEPEFVELCMVLNRTYVSTDLEFKQEIKSSYSNAEDYMLPDHLKAYFGDLDFVDAFGSPVSCPNDLIEVIDNVIKHLSHIACGLTTTLFSELHHREARLIQ